MSIEPHYSLSDMNTHLIKVIDRRKEYDYWWKEMTKRVSQYCLSLRHFFKKGIIN